MEGLLFLFVVFPATATSVDNGVVIPVPELVELMALSGGSLLAKDK